MAHVVRNDSEDDGDYYVDVKLDSKFERMKVTSHGDQALFITRVKAASRPTGDPNCSRDTTGRGVRRSNWSSAWRPEPVARGRRGIHRQHSRVR